MPMTRFGLSAGLPSASRRFCQRRLSASPPSIAASLDPVVEQPVALFGSGAFHRLLRIETQRDSSSAVCGYSSLSIMFLSKHSAINFSAWGSIHVETKVATLSRALPSSISSSWMIWYATSAGISPAGSSCRGIWPSRPKSGSTDSSSAETGWEGCLRVTGLLLRGRAKLLQVAGAPASSIPYEGEGDRAARRATCCNARNRRRLKEGNHVVGRRNRRLHPVHHDPVHPGPDDPQEGTRLAVRVRDLLPDPLADRRGHAAR